MPRRVKLEEREPAAVALGAAIRRVRTERGESLEAVADRIPRIGRNGEDRTMDGRYLGEIERGFHSPTIVTAQQIAQALETSLAELVREL